MPPSSPLPPLPPRSSVPMGVSVCTGVTVGSAVLPLPLPPPPSPPPPAPRSVLVGSADATACRERLELPRRRQHVGRFDARRIRLALDSKLDRVERPIRAAQASLRLRPRFAAGTGHGQTTDHLGSDRTTGHYSRE